MRNPIDALSNAAIERPKAATATILILVLGISSMTAGPLPEMLGVGIVFDNSEMPSSPIQPPMRTSGSSTRSRSHTNPISISFEFSSILNRR